MVKVRTKVAKVVSMAKGTESNTKAKAMGPTGVISTRVASKVARTKAKVRPLKVTKVVNQAQRMAKARAAKAIVGCAASQVIGRMSAG